MVPETLEPSLQLASAVLSQLNMPPDDVQEAIQEFRRAHMGELQVGASVQNYIGMGCRNSAGELMFRNPAALSLHCVVNGAWEPCRGVLRAEEIPDS